MLYLIMRMYLITNHVINKRKQVFLTAACVCRPWQRAPPSRRAAVRQPWCAWYTIYDYDTTTTAYAL